MLRYYWIIIGMCVSLFIGMGAVNAATSEEARQFVDTVGKQVLDTVNGSADEAQKQQKLRQLFSDNVDMDWMGRFVLGRAWTQATQDQRSNYLQAYRDYLLARYTTNFADYAGSKYTITDVKPEAGGQYVVGMDVKSPHAKDPEIKAGYRLRSWENGQFKINDIIIEGVSLITTQRSEFASVAQKDGLDKLIEQLKVKTANPA